MFTVNGTLGMDPTNNSYFQSLKLKIAKMFDIGNMFKGAVGVQAANMWGINIPK